MNRREMKHKIVLRPLAGGVNSNGVFHGHWCSNQRVLRWTGRQFVVYNVCGMCLRQSDNVTEELEYLEWKAVGLLLVHGKRRDSLS